jgi:hypothetical protein
MSATLSPPISTLLAAARSVSNDRIETGSGVVTDATGADQARDGSQGIGGAESRRNWQDLRSWGAADSDRVFAMAAAHGMRPMLYRALKDLGGDEITARMRDTLQPFVQENLRENLRKTGELILLLRQFAKRDLSVIPYKGPTLAALAYGDLGLREFGDLDLLIRKEDFPAAQDLLIDHGYSPELFLTGRKAMSFARECNVMAFWNPIKEVSVELHWELSPKYLPFSPDFQRLRQRMIPSYPGGRQVLTLSTEDLLVYLCAHGAKHAWERLSWITDVAGLIHRRPELNWTDVCDLAIKQGCERVLALGLRLAHDLTGISLPAKMEEWVHSDEAVNGLSAKVTQWLFQEGGASRGLKEQTLFIVWTQRRWSDKLKSVAQVLLTPSVADWAAYPRLQNFPAVFPVLRPLRLLRKLRQGTRT